VEGYPERLAGTTGGDAESVARHTIDSANALLRRLMPLPGSETVMPLSLLPMPGQRGALRSGDAAATLSKPLNATEGIVGEEAASIVSQAASILDEEMAKGVMAARNAGPSTSYGRADAGHPVLRQMHEFVDNIAALWPIARTVAPPPFAPPQPTANEAEPLAEVRPRATVKPGQRATISMTLRNNENRVVRLVPVATDLLGSRGGRIPSALLEFSPSACSLEPQQQRDLAIATTVPADIEPGCYSGLLVVRGLDYLRALITVEVV
jgi:hypothetical protein